ncbi:MAG: M28 family metallopeptidase [Acidobacteriota bacterium]
MSILSERVRGIAPLLAAAALGTAAAPAEPGGADAAAAHTPAEQGPEPAPARRGDPGIHGFHRGSLVRQRRLESLLLKGPAVERLRRDARLLTEEPHVAGTPENDRVARYIAGEFRKAGLAVELRRYSVYMGYVSEALLELVEPGPPAVLSNPEDRFEEDQDSFDARAALNWNAYSPSCDLTREVVYVHHGRPEDYEALEEMEVPVRGRIVLARYFRGYRGGKALEAHRRGAAAVVFYSDPAEDGHVRGEVYPHGPWGPPGHFQRGATTHDFIVPGDPLTPGWASLPGARRIPPEESRVLPRIPSIPISGRDARRILEALKGPVAPEPWQGGLPVTYHVGPGPARLRLRIESSFGNRTITNVIGTLRGSDEPDRKILLSNHHDAWVYGAADPVSGTVSMIELARVAGELARRGLRPRRTLVFASWDAEEWTLTGSTEWGEEFRHELAGGGVACLNVDSAVSGPRFRALAVPTLRRFIAEAMRDVPDPRSGRDLYRETADSAGDEEGFSALYGLETAGRDPRGVGFGLLGSGSDYTVFFNHIGIPSLDGGFEGPYGVYHSIYDDFFWMSRLADPGFLYHAAMTRLWGVMAYRMANADILPFEESPYPADVRSYLDDLEEAAGEGGPLPDLSPLREALDEWSAAAADLDRLVAQALAATRPPARTIDRVNAALMRAERDLLHRRGIPGRPWFRHLIYAPLPSYAAETLPGLREAVKDGDARRAGAQARVLKRALRARAATIARAASALAGARR